MAEEKSHELPGWAIFLITTAVLVGVPGALIYFVLLLRVVGTVWTFDFSTLSGITQLGSIGDVIGGLFNPLFALLAFGAVAFSTWLQRRELTAQVEATKSNANAMKDETRTQVTFEMNRQLEKTWNEFFLSAVALEKDQKQNLNSALERSSAFHLWKHCYKIRGCMSMLEYAKMSAEIGPSMMLDYLVNLEMSLDHLRYKDPANIFTLERAKSDQKLWKEKVVNRFLDKKLKHPEPG